MYFSNFFKLLLNYVILRLRIYVKNLNLQKSTKNAYLKYTYVL